MTTEVVLLAAPPITGIGHRILPVAVVLALLIVVWYAAAVWLNAPQVVDRFVSDGKSWNARQLIEAI